jgi:hypothetical protein
MTAQTGYRVQGQIDGDQLVIIYGPEGGEGVQMPSGQTELRLSVKRVAQLVIDAADDKKKARDGRGASER